MLQEFPLGALAGLDDLFADYGYFAAGPDVPAGYVPLLGLPGSIDTRTQTFLHVLPRAEVRDAVAGRCTNGAIGGFRAIQSAQHLRDGKLPVFAFDFPHIASFPLALVPHDEHMRFAQAKP